MAHEPLRRLVQRLHRLSDVPAEGALSDAQILERFVSRRDEAAFEVLVWRHGPMVLGVCRRILRHEQDAEDAFQATFLILARKAAGIGKREALAGWLYRVAYRVCTAALTQTRKREQLEPWTELPAACDEDPVWRDLRPVLDEEVSRLPEKYRTVVILCHLEGKTNEEAADLLGCPRGTVQSRLGRARELLRRRLTRRGITLSAGLAAVLATGQALATELGGRLALRTVAAAVPSAGKVTSAFVTDRVTALVEGVLRSMFVNKLKTTTLVLFLVTAFGLGAGILGRRLIASGGEEEARKRPVATNTLPRLALVDDEKPEPDDLVRRAARMYQSRQNLKLIGVALHNYHDQYGHFPASAIYAGGIPGGGVGGMGPGPMGGFPPPGEGGMPGVLPMGAGAGRPMSGGGGEGGTSSPMGGGIGGSPMVPTGAGPMPGDSGRTGLPGGVSGGMGMPATTGKPLLSWRVAILPYINQDALYRQFKLNEPWDSPHNKRLLTRMPKTFAPAGADRQAGLTHYQVFVGPGAGFERGRYLRLADFTDGTSNTIFVVEAGTPVPWTKPEDLPYVPDQALSRLGGLFDGDFHALLADGSVRLISRKVSDDLLRRLINRQDGEPIDWARVSTLSARLIPGGKVTLGQATKMNARLKGAITATRKEIDHTREELKLLKTRLELGAPGLDPKTLKLLEENAKLQETLATVLAELEQLKEEQARLRKDLERRFPEKKER
jgi:RNA polymerase sigma factor (sigma-70 family)